MTHTRSQARSAVLVNLETFMTMMHSQVVIFTYSKYVDHALDAGLSPLSKQEFAYWARYMVRKINLLQNCNVKLITGVWKSGSVPAWEKDAYVRWYDWDCEDSKYCYCVQQE
jgi:hypothetical protein